MYGASNVNFMTWGKSFNFMSSVLLLNNNIGLEGSPFSAFLYFLIFFFSGKLVFRGMAMQIAKDELRDEKMKNKLHASLTNHDYELVPFALKRLRMWLGLKKQKKIRHHVCTISTYSSINVNCLRFGLKE